MASLHLTLYVFNRGTIFSIKTFFSIYFLAQKQGFIISPYVSAIMLVRMCVLWILGPLLSRLKRDGTMLCSANGETIYVKFQPNKSMVWESGGWVDIATDACSTWYIGSCAICYISYVSSFVSHIWLCGGLMPTHSIKLGVMLSTLSTYNWDCILQRGDWERVYNFG